MAEPANYATGPATGAVAVTIEECSDVIERRLGKLDDAERHRLRVSLASLIGKHLEGVGFNILFQAPKKPVRHDVRPMKER
jgi:hypothetical protein